MSNKLDHGREVEVEEVEGGDEVDVEEVDGGDEVDVEEVDGGAEERRGGVEEVRMISEKSKEKITI